MLKPARTACLAGQVGVAHRRVHAVLLAGEAERVLELVHVLHAALLGGELRRGGRQGGRGAGGVGSRRCGHQAGSAAPAARIGGTRNVQLHRHRHARPRRQRRTVLPHPTWVLRMPGEIIMNCEWMCVILPVFRCLQMVRKLRGRWRGRLQGWRHNPHACQAWAVRRACMCPASCLLMLDCHHAPWVHTCPGKAMHGPRMGAPPPARLHSRAVGAVAHGQHLGAEPRELVHAVVVGKPLERLQGAGARPVQWRQGRRRVRRCGRRRAAAERPAAGGCS